MSAPAIIANGQLAATSTRMFAGSDIDAKFGGRVDILLRNTSGSLTETVVITLVSLLTGLTTRLKRVILGPNEEASIHNLPLGPGDIVKGTTTDATTVDYTVLNPGQPMSFSSHDTAGAVKQTNSGISGNQSIGGLILGSVETGVTAAGSTNADATGLAAGKMIHEVGGADDTKGVKIADGDNIVGAEIEIVNTVSNKILKIYPPTGAAINGGTATTGAFSTTSGKSANLRCTATNVWRAWSTG